jgi:methylated-DNA-[protein]-cysteine S-methyltransferase
METPIGAIQLVWQPDALVMLSFDENEERLFAHLKRHYGPCELTPREAPAAIRGPIEAYFQGDIEAIDRIPVKFDGTEFQQLAWNALRTIPAGTTISYSDQAKRIGRPTATRAVGLANGSNPIGIVVPCHRVIGANGSLTGYGGGMDRKRWLLEHERLSLMRQH